MSKQQTVQKILTLKQQFDQVTDQQRFQHWMEIRLTTMQFKCLLYIVQTNDATSGKLSSVLGVTPADVTGIVRRLISEGLVQRKENSEDRRFFLLEATDKGKQIMTKLCRNAEDYLIRSLVSLDEEDLNHLYLGLNAISRSMQERIQKVKKSGSCGKKESSLCKDKER